MLHKEILSHMLFVCSVVLLTYVRQDICLIILSFYASVSRWWTTGVFDTGIIAEVLENEQGKHFTSETQVILWKLVQWILHLLTWRESSDIQHSCLSTLSFRTGKSFFSLKFWFQWELILQNLMWIAKSSRFFLISAFWLAEEGDVCAYACVNTMYIWESHDFPFTSHWVIT